MRKIKNVLLRSFSFVVLVVTRSKSITFEFEEGHFDTIELRSDWIAKGWSVGHMPSRTILTAHNGCYKVLTSKG